MLGRNTSGSTAGPRPSPGIGGIHTGLKPVTPLAPWCTISAGRLHSFVAFWLPTAHAPATGFTDLQREQDSAGTAHLCVTQCHLGRLPSEDSPSPEHPSWPPTWPPQVTGASHITVAKSQGHVSQGRQLPPPLARAPGVTRCLICFIPCWKLTHVPGTERQSLRV